jgi:hypothetical protein
VETIQSLRVREREKRRGNPAPIMTGDPHPAAHEARVNQLEVH